LNQGGSQVGLRLLIATLVLLILFFGGRPALSGETITCEDGEKFIVEDKGVIESAIPLVQNEKIIVDSRSCRLTYYRDGQAVKSYPVAIGTRKTPSPIGEWKIVHKGGSWGGGFGARWLGINVPWGIYGIHGTNKPGSIGYGSSHGCIRMFNHHVIELYKMVKVGTPVYILGNPPLAPLRCILQLKSTGKDVLLLQFALRKVGFDPGMADARYGSETELAISRLQAFYGLAVTGRASTNEQYLLGLR
jgi:hypothetical protein